MFDVVSAFVGHEEAEDGAHQLAHMLEGARTTRAEEGFQFGEGQFDRIEIGTVRREKPQVRAGLLNRRPDFGLFVGGEIIEHHHIARAERGHEHLLNVGEERRAIDRAIKHRRGCQLRRAERRDNGVRLPVTARGVIRDAIASPAARIAAQEIRRHARFVHEHILPSIMERLHHDPLPPRRRDIRPTLFVGVYGFF